MKKIKHYAFLDVVIDVFYSIILYNVFMAFKGFDLNSVLVFFAIFIMMDYWWSARSFSEFPKYYLVDLYFITGLMLVFAQWSNYFDSVQRFVGVLIIFLAIDTIYTISAIFIHKEKIGRKKLWFYFWTELCLTFVYCGLYVLTPILTVIWLMAIILPYLIIDIWGFYVGIEDSEFLDNNEQPY
ncbi:MAG: hypothetical protein WCW47_00300 [Candidatus Paceibacterota bacterium]|jgi:hypothetical protein